VQYSLEEKHGNELMEAYKEASGFAASDSIQEVFYNAYW